MNHLKKKEQHIPAVHLLTILLLHIKSKMHKIMMIASINQLVFALCFSIQEYPIISNNTTQANRLLTNLNPL